MKTLNSILRTILLTLALVSTATTAFAYDMKVNGICYNINGNEATVTYIHYDSGYGISGYNRTSKYTNHITIPDTIIFNGLKYTVTSIGEFAFANCYTLKSISIPQTIVSISDYSFYNCMGLKNIAIPESVTSIGNSAFWNCGNLTGITIPDSVTFIGTAAFANCDNMTYLTIGSSVASIGTEAFAGTPLAYVTCLAEIPPSFAASNSAPFYSYVNTTLYVPLSSIELYKTAPIWKNFKLITDFKPNFFSLNDISTMHGDTIVVPVVMNNENDITAFQTDIYLVEGFEMVKDGDDYLVELSNRKGRDHVIIANETPDGAIRIASYSPTLKAFKNNEGELFYITVKVPDNGDGVYPIILKNTRLTTIDEDEILSPDVFCNVAVAPFIHGDANMSGDITIADVVVTAKYILFQNPEPFNLDAADMNGDSKITITDVVKIANLILDQDYEETTSLRSAATNPISDRMSGKADGGAASIYLDNEQDFTALQMDLTLPEGMTASDFTLTDRASDLGLIVKDRDNGKVRVLAYTPNLKTIKGNNGEVLTFNVAGTKGDILVDRIELVNVDGKAVRLNAFTIGASNVTELDELAAGKAIAKIEYFNLAGQQISEPAIGVTLVVTTYTDGKRTTNKIIR